MAEIEPEAINNILQSILDGVYECMGDTVDGRPENAFMSFGRPPDDCCDYLTIYLQTLQPTVGFPVVDNGMTQDCGTTRMATVHMKLVRSCWPIVQNNPMNPFPPSTEIQEASEKLTIDANVVWCCLTEGLSSGEFYPDGNALCKDWRMLDLQVDQARGACAGFTVRFQLELEACCG